MMFSTCCVSPSALHGHGRPPPSGTGGAHVEALSKRTPFASFTIDKREIEERTNPSSGSQDAEVEASRNGPPDSFHETISRRWSVSALASLEQLLMPPIQVIIADNV